MFDKKNKIVNFEIINEKNFFKSSIEFIRRIAEVFEVGEENLKVLENVISNSITLVAKHSDGVPIFINIYESDNKLFIEIINRGSPIFFDSDNMGLINAADSLENFRIENRGREGQAIVIEIRFGENRAKQSLGYVGEAYSLTDENIEMRLLKEGEERKISELFFRVYGYRYIHEFVYYPEKILNFIKEKKLISFVAVKEDKDFVAHVGLIQKNSKPLVYEPCLGVVHPQLKSRGIFSSLFKLLMSHLETMTYDYCFIDFVTNHIRTQKLVSNYDPVHMSIFVGCQNKETQARLEKLGLGEDPKKSERYSLLFSVLKGKAKPFGEFITLPESLGELLGFLLKPLELIWSPTQRFDALPKNGEYQMHLQPTQNAVYFELFEPGKEPLLRIISEWQELLKHGYKYAAIDIPVGKNGLGNAWDILSERGFFLSGFLPFRLSDKLAIRFQSLPNTEISFEEIELFDSSAKKLLSIIKDTFERNLSYG